jgi:hypothetical protein
MSFVHVINCGAIAQLGKGPDTPDSEDDLLSQAHIPVAPVEVRGNIPVFLSVFYIVGIQQEKGNPPDLDAPNSHL